MFLTINTLSYIAPGNPNRDLNGAPKSSVVGGTNRQAFSSASIKRAWKAAFEKAGARAGQRTVAIPELLTEQITALDPNLENADWLAAQALSLLGLDLVVAADDETPAGDDESEEAPVEPKVTALAPNRVKTSDLVSRETLARVAEIIVAHADAFMPEYDAKKKAYVLTGPTKGAVSKISAPLRDKALRTEIVTAWKSNPSLAKAAFGTFVPANGELSSDAAVQVSRGISVDTAVVRYELATQRDQHLERTNYLEQTALVSSTMHRFAGIDIEALSEVYGVEGEDLRDILEVLVTSFMLALPNGKVNGSAHLTLPDFVMVSLEPESISTAAAFQQAITSADGRSVSQVAGETMVDYVERRDRLFGYERAFVGTVDVHNPDSASLREVITQAVEAL